ncbi:MAG: hypothetical protein CR974_01980 [Gammaproteobacteria bacterium]|nr:MAG: hypothetical protein CR974_01980 [Gammaproteobacteria bacterium]
MLAKRYAELFQHNPLSELMANVSARTNIYQQSGVSIPTTITDTITENCYTVSPYAMLIGYGQDELVKLPNYLRPPLKLALKAFSAYLHRADMDKVQILNNFCLSTNILSRQFQALDMRQLLELACHSNPEHTVLIRSINAKQHQPLMEKLSANGWQWVASRQVYLVNDMPSSLKTKDNRKDIKLLADPRYHFHVPRCEADYAQAEHWYIRLYLNKYSSQNVQFTARGLQALHEVNILDLHLLYDNELQRHVGAVGMVSDKDYMTVPIVGYDIERPQNEALYRRLVVFSLNQAHQQGKWLNQSAGAPQFKRNRGAEATIEYTAVYTAHLPKSRQRVWRGLVKLSPFYERLLQRWKL